MSENKDKTQVEQMKVTGRNNDIVVRQLVEKYNASEGWAVVRVSSSPLSLSVYLERNVKQSNTKKVEHKDTPEKEVIVEDVVATQEEFVDEKDKPTAPKKATASKTTTKK